MNELINAFIHSFINQMTELMNESNDWISEWNDWMNEWINQSIKWLNELSNYHFSPWRNVLYAVLKVLFSCLWILLKIEPMILVLL